MSARALFQGLATRLRKRGWGELQELVDELVAGMESEAPIDLHQPLVLNNHTNTYPVQIANVGDGAQHLGLTIRNESGQQTDVGIGLGTKGVVAAELVPDPNYVLDPEVVRAARAPAGGGGDASLDPGGTVGVPPGTGHVPDTALGGDIGSGYGQGTSGSGTPYGYPMPFPGQGGIGLMLTLLQVTANNNIRIIYNGNTYYWMGEDIPTDGLTQNLEVVIPEISCVDGSITYSTKWLEIVNGLIVGITDDEPA